MKLVLTEDQKLIASTVAGFVNEKLSVSRVRALRDSEDPVGFSRILWKEMAELGWTGIPLPELHGGAGLGLGELVLVLEALGKVLAPEPFLSTVILGARALLHGGSITQQSSWLPLVAAGDGVLTLAYQEIDSRYDLRSVRTRADLVDGSFRLFGEKVQVLDGHVADALVVSARTNGELREAEGISLFLVPANTPGLEIARQDRMDGRNVAVVRFKGVNVGRDMVIGEKDHASSLIETVIDEATVGLCAEMLGGMERLFQMTLDHLRHRKQFDVAVGSFQALKHRSADIFIEIELAKSCVMAAARALDDGDSDAQSLVSLAKARCSDAYMRTANEGVQMFGGVGMTDEYDIGFYLKRARVSELSFGDAAFHRDRWARLGGY